MKRLEVIEIERKTEKEEMDGSKGKEKVHLEVKKD